MHGGPRTSVFFAMPDNHGAYAHRKPGPRTHARQRYDFVIWTHRYTRTPGRPAYDHTFGNGVCTGGPGKTAPAGRHRPVFTSRLAPSAVPGSSPRAKPVITPCVSPGVTPGRTSAGNMVVLPIQMQTPRCRSEPGILRLEFFYCFKATSYISFLPEARHWHGSCR
jgi:hypothetical protein